MILCLVEPDFKHSAQFLGHDFVPKEINIIAINPFFNVTPFQITPMRFYFKLQNIFLNLTSASTRLENQIQHRISWLPWLRVSDVASAKSRAKHYDEDRGE